MLIPVVEDACHANQALLLEPELIGFGKNNKCLGVVINLFCFQVSTGNNYRRSARSFGRFMTEHRQSILDEAHRSRRRSDLWRLVLVAREAVNSHLRLQRLLQDHSELPAPMLRHPVQIPTTPGFSQKFARTYVWQQESLGDAFNCHICRITVTSLDELYHHWCNCHFIFGQ